MRSSSIAWIGLSLLLGFAVARIAALAAEPARPAPSPAEVAAIGEAMTKIKPLFDAKGKAQRGEWLEKHDEPGQTFAQYIAGNPNRPTRKRTTLYIQPLGSFSKTQRKLLDETADFLGRVYGIPLKTLDPVGLDAIPDSARRKNPSTGKEQLLTDYILKYVLPKRLPADGVAMLGLTATDLWPGEGWNFVFGEASPQLRAGVWSSARYGDPDESDEAYHRCLLRMCKVAAHETGHMLGIMHCTAYECGMNGSNSLPETDRGRLAFCPECSAKIWWACGVRPADWYKSLIEFADKHDFKDEAALWRKCRDAVQ